MISVICCYNDSTQFNQMLESLRKQDLQFELVAIDNQRNKYSSAASALNWGGLHANGEILVFTHQDVLFNSVTSLSRLILPLKDKPQEDVCVGIYGARHDKTLGIIDGCNRVETVDECCFAMTKSTFEKYRFNEDICNSWHLYAVEICLRIIESGGIVLENNCDIEHLSIGNVNEDYMRTFKDLLFQFKSRGYIATTCRSMPTNIMAYYCYYFPWKIKKRLLGNYPLMFKLRGFVKGNR